MLRAKDAAVTRESKLALILSFVLILVVGVLVSDYFSQANSMDPDRLEEQGRQPLAQLPGVERSRIDNAIERVMPSANSASNLATKMASDPSPVRIANGSNRSGSLLNELSSGLGKTIDQFRAPALASPLSDKSSQSTVADRGLGQIQHAVYTVQEGDSLYQIASRMLGDGNRWQEVQRLNRSKVGPSGIIHPGMEIKLPVNARVSEPQRVQTTPRPVRNQKRNAAKKSETYTVISGDTLGEISMKLLGTSRRVNEFVKLNGLKDANGIRVGMKLQVPSK